MNKKPSKISEIFSKLNSRRTQISEDELEDATRSPEPEAEVALDPKDERLHIVFKIFYIFTALSALIMLAFIISEPFADFFNKNISQIFRLINAKLTTWIPFSFAELILILMPFIVAFMVWYAAKYKCETWKSTLTHVLALVSVICLLFSMFVWTFAAGYHGSSLEKKLELEDKAVSAEELHDTSLILIEKVNEYAKKVSFKKQSFSKMPYTISEMNDILLRDYERLCDEYDFIDTFDSNIKQVAFSALMSYTHITGVYSYFTGEANINVAFPDYTIPYTAAHELAHQRGIAREDEANFIAFLVCINSEDDYIRYSAYMNMYEYVASALYRANPKLYYDARSHLNTDTKYEMSAYSEFFKKYQDSTVSKVSETINNTHLILNGTEGSKSYGLVVDLSVAYYKKLGLIE